MKLKPYTREELERVDHYDVRARVGGKWFFTVMTTRFISNGLLDRLERALKEGKSFRCKPPATGTHYLVDCSEAKTRFDLVAIPHDRL